MSKKHYKELAEIIRTTDNKREFINSLCSFLKRDNSNFDKQRFLDACGIKEVV